MILSFVQLLLPCSVSDLLDDDNEDIGTGMGENSKASLMTATANVQTHLEISGAARKRILGCLAVSSCCMSSTLVSLLTGYCLDCSDSAQTQASARSVESSTIRGDLARICTSWDFSQINARMLSEMCCFNFLRSSFSPIEASKRGRNSERNLSRTKTWHEHALIEGMWAQGPDYEDEDYEENKRRLTREELRRMLQVRTAKHQTRFPNRSSSRTRHANA